VDLVIYCQCNFTDGSMHYGYVYKFRTHYLGLCHNLGKDRRLERNQYNR